MVAPQTNPQACNEQQLQEQQTTVTTTTTSTTKATNSNNDSRVQRAAAVPTLQKHFNAQGAVMLIVRPLKGCTSSRLQSPPGASSCCVCAHLKYGAYLLVPILSSYILHIAPRPFAPLPGRTPRAALDPVPRLPSSPAFPTRPRPLTHAPHSPTSRSLRAVPPLSQAAAPCPCAHLDLQHGLRLNTGGQSVT